MRSKLTDTTQIHVPMTDIKLENFKKVLLLLLKNQWPVRNQQKMITMDRRKTKRLTIVTSPIQTILNLCHLVGNVEFVF